MTALRVYKDVFVLSSWHHNATLPLMLEIIETFLLSKDIAAVQETSQCVCTSLYFFFKGNQRPLFSIWILIWSNLIALGFLVLIIVFSDVFLSSCLFYFMLLTFICVLLTF